MRLKRTLLYIFILLTINVTYVKASQQSLGISPAKVSDLYINIGETKDLEFNIKNICTTDRDDFTFEVIPSFEIEDNYGDKVDVDSNVVTFDSYNISIKPNSEIISHVKIRLPETLEEGYYKINLHYSEGDSPINVPIYVAYGDEKKFRNLNSDFEIYDISIDDKYIKRLDLKLNTIASDVLSMIKEPAFQFDFKDKTYLCFKKNLEVSGTEAKYIKVNDTDLEENVDSIQFEEDVNIKLSNGEVVNIPCKENTLNKLKTELNKIYSQVEKNITLRDLLSSITVPRKENWDYINMYSTCKIKNTGESNLDLSINTSLLWNNSPIGVSVTDSVMLRSSDCAEISIPLDSEVMLSNNKYVLSNEVSTSDVSKYKTRKIIIDNLLTYKLIVIILSIIINVLAIVIKIIEKFRRRKKC